MDNSEKREQILFSHFYRINLLLVFLNIFANFYGTPLVKWIYLLQALLAVISAIFFRLPHAIHFMVTLAFFEGQGRLVWGYHPLFRIIFDMTSVVVIIKSIVINKSIFSPEKIPKTLFFLILVHFIWFFISLFNTATAGPLIAFSTSKYYIFPFFLFFAFLENPIDVKSKNFEMLRNLFLILLFLSAVLCLYQMSVGLDHLIKISPYYLSLRAKFSEFTGARFRPYGTSHVSGGMSSFFYLTLGFLFLLPWKKMVAKIFFQIVVLLTFATLFVSQIRSAMIKYVIIFLGIIFANLLIKKLKLKKILVGVISLTIFINIVMSLKLDIFKDVFDLSWATERYGALFKEGTLTSSRVSPERALELVSNKLKEYPFGVGLGMATGLLQGFADKQKDNVLAVTGEYWSADNLIVMIFYELGYGGFFYLSILCFLPLILFSITLKSLNRIRDLAYVFAISFISVFVALLGNWGAVALPFNPESFFVWFWVAFAINNFRQHISVT